MAKSHKYTMRRALLIATGASLCAMLLVSMHAMPSPHGFVVAMQLDAMRATPPALERWMQNTPKLYWTGSTGGGAGYYADLVANPGERPEEYLEKQRLLEQQQQARQESDLEQENVGLDRLQNVQEEHAAMHHAAGLPWHPEMGTDISFIPTAEFPGSMERVPGSAQRFVARAFPVQQLGAMGTAFPKSLQPRSWVSVTLTPKAAQFGGGTVKLLPPPQKDSYDEKIETPLHHITANPGRGTATWKYGADAGKDDYEDKDDGSFNYNFVTVSPKDARVGAYVRYVMGGPPGAVQSDAAKAAEAAAKAKAAAHAALDAEPLLRPTKIFCTTSQHSDGAKPPPCEVVQAVPDLELDDDVYD